MEPPRGDCGGESCYAGPMPTPITTNTLFYGDNLEILREYIADASVDLIYRDPRSSQAATWWARWPAKKALSACSLR
jgi:hypothetical protein